MIIDTGESTLFEIPPGIRTTIQINRPYNFIVETVGGTIIEGRATPTTPLIVTAGSDITGIKLIFDDTSFMSPHLV